VWELYLGRPDPQEVSGRATSVTGSGRKAPSGFPEKGRESNSGTGSGSGTHFRFAGNGFVDPLPVTRKWALVPEPLPGVPKDRKHWTYEVELNLKGLGQT